MLDKVHNQFGKEKIGVVVDSFLRSNNVHILGSFQVSRVNICGLNGISILFPTYFIYSCWLYFDLSFARFPIFLLNSSSGVSKIISFLIQWHKKPAYHLIPNIIENSKSLFYPLWSVRIAKWLRFIYMWLGKYEMQCRMLLWFTFKIHMVSRIQNAIYFRFCIPF